MKITPYNRPDLNPYKHQPQQAGQELRKSAADQVEISEAAKKLQQSSKWEAERKARVEQLKLHIQSGEYKVHPKAVAEGIAKYFTEK
ncbi:negative regulator of flagellin synthesis FlgM [Bacillus thermophilus]|uniref:Negative regulator of flagellin synthesis n=1 Tax=Siminovitchia thermophila TaxID=1245522 RepID=A0ABS2R3H6_9BACI|nr:flagellar biosynthesis anti-sigma factor FlgM [Siminovitchia thermophila]MBM7714186.1 negative regulator of flagellin synthesis FlgM [Siminovitchia thermophila]ONK23398.1 flagellar biosynthesis anti-sigma factor FlgM [Bacillus sp. VT-16-64]